MVHTHGGPDTLPTVVLGPSENQSCTTLTNIVVVFFIAAHWALFVALIRQWLVEDDMAHGVFVPLVAAWAVWEKRRALSDALIRPSLWGLALMLWGFTQSVMADLGAELYLYRTAFLLSLSGLLAFLRGWATVRILMFPLVLLLFMFPIPGVLYREVTFPLQLLASRLAEGLLELIGYTVIREGNLLELAGQRLSVVEACSGVRSLLTLGFFSACYGWFTDSRPWIRWALLGLAMPVAVITNAGRIVVTAVIGEYDQDLAYGTFHAVSGWGILVLAALLLVATHSLLHGYMSWRRRHEIGGQSPRPA